MSKRLTINQLQEASGMSRATIYRYVSEKKLPAPKKVHGSAMWDTRAVREAMARMKRLLLA